MLRLVMLSGPEPLTKGDLVDLQPVSDNEVFRTSDGREWLVKGIDGAPEWCVVSTSLGDQRLAITVFDRRLARTRAERTSAAIRAGRPPVEGNLRKRGDLPVPPEAQRAA